MIRTSFGKTGQLSKNALDLMQACSVMGQNVGSQAWGQTLAKLAMLEVVLSANSHDPELEELVGTGSLHVTAILGMTNAPFEGFFCAHIMAQLVDVKDKEEAHKGAVTEMSNFIEAIIDCALNVTPSGEAMVDALKGSDMKVLQLEQALNAVKREVASRFNVKLQRGEFVA